MGDAADAVRGTMDYVWNEVKGVVKALAPWLAACGVVALVIYLTQGEVTRQQAAFEIQAAEISLLREQLAQQGALPLLDTRSR